MGTQRAHLETDPSIPLRTLIRYANSLTRRIPKMVPTMQARTVNRLLKKCKKLAVGDDELIGFEAFRRCESNEMPKSKTSLVRVLMKAEWQSGN